ncbi:MAG: TIGR02270 family protein, partial [Polyangiaceae bacterium]|nr:TIGR02270 family protein [Polyangiaceae bacterium]
AGQEMCKAALADPGAGEAFAAAALAVERADARALAEVLASCARSPALARGLVSGLGWAPLRRAQPFLTELLAEGAPPELGYLGIAASAAHRHDPGAPLARAVHASDARLRARALRAAGELGRADLLPDLRRELRSDHEACRFWAAWSAALLGEPAAADVLWRFALEGGGFAGRACGVAARRTEPAHARARIRSIADEARDLRAALAGAAALGDPALGPWVIECMEIAGQARYAGLTFTLITGGDLAAQGLSGQAPEGFASGPTDDPGDPDVAPDPDARLPWPDVAAVRAWWARRSVGLAPGARLLLGEPIDLERLWRVLRAGSQPARAAAAIEMGSLRRGWPLFEVRAPGFRQRRALAG